MLSVVLSFGKYLVLVVSLMDITCNTSYVIRQSLYKRLGNILRFMFNLFVAGFGLSLFVDQINFIFSYLIGLIRILFFFYVQQG